MIFWLAGSIGTLFSGFLQAAAYTNLDGVAGRAGWRWLFIIDGIITLPLALAGYLFFPNLPQGGKKTWWTTEDEHILSVKRMQAIGRAGTEPWTRAKARRIFSSWHTYLLRKTLSNLIKAFIQLTILIALLYVVWNNGSTQIGMGYWLKSFNATPAPLPGTTYTVAQIDNCGSKSHNTEPSILTDFLVPLVVTALFIVVALTWGWLSDGPCRGARWPFIYAGAVITVGFITEIALRIR